MSGPDPADGADNGEPPELPVVAGGRAEARERAVHLLYESRMKGLAGGEVLARLPIAPDPYAAGLVEGVELHREELDAVVGRLAHGWAPERMAALDLVVLEVGCFELAHRPDVPTEVVLSEATELASRYGSTDDSAGFVNGVLAAAARELRPA